MIFLLVYTQVTKAQTPQQKLPSETRILFLLDGSGSMLARWENTYRIAVAKRLLKDMVDSLRSNEHLQLALRIYGHQYDRRLKRCDDTRLEVPFGKDNHDRIISVLKNLEPKGTTPIAYALEQAANDFPADKHARNIIIIITDGIESCNGDPCAVSLALQRKGIFLKPFIIGIGMDKNFEEQFGCMGSFFDANNIADFRNALSKVLFQSLGKTTVSVELLDADGKPNEKDVNVSFINHFTQTSAFEFVHYRDAQGRPDTVEVDPVLTYDLVVNTIPPVRRQQVEISPGKHNVLRVKAPQGTVAINQSGHTEYAGGVTAMVQRPDDHGILTIFSVPGNVKMLAGDYDITCTTLPRVTFRKVHIAQHETLSLQLEKPGVINLVSASPGVGSLYVLTPDEQQTWIYNLDDTKTRQTVTLQPGRYKVVFRSHKARGSKFTKVRTFEISPGSSTTLQL